VRKDLRALRPHRIVERGITLVSEGHRLFAALTVDGPLARRAAR
jgi:ABC-type branched-subunit amino acid transport system ATPase component